MRCSTKRLIRFLKLFFKDKPIEEMQEVLEEAMPDHFVLIMPKTMPKKGGC